MIQQSVINTCWLTVNRLCQLRCKWCYAKDGGYDSSSDMDLSTVSQLINIMEGLGSQTCKILGGEPSVYPHITYVLEQLKISKIQSIIITNGIRYSNKAIMRKHFEAGLNSLIISLKAGTEQSYKELTGANVLAKVYQAVENLTEFQGGVTITITEEIHKEIIPAISNIVSAGAKFINLHFCSPTLISGKPENHSMLPPDKAAIVMMDAVEHLEKLNVSYNVQISIPFCLFRPDFIQRLVEKNCITSGCIVNKKSGIIFDNKGEAGFCNHMMDYPFGRLGIDFINAEQLQMLYLSQNNFFDVTNRVPSEKCLECPINNICCGGCPLQWTQFDPSIYVKGGDAFKHRNRILQSFVGKSTFYQPITNYGG